MNFNFFPSCAIEYLLKNMALPAGNTVEKYSTYY